MKALVKVRPEPGAVEYMDWKMPVVKTGDVLIQVEAAGLCEITDIPLYDWDIGVQTTVPELPRVMGHEFAGIVAETGPQVTELKKGDRVAVDPLLYCGDCYFCRDGLQNICNNRPHLGLNIDGAFAQYISVRSKNVYKLDDRVSIEVGAMSELLGIGLNAIERIHMNTGDTVVVVAGGPLGLVTAVLSKHSGAAKVFVIGLEAESEGLEVASRLGLTVIPTEILDPKEFILDRTDGMGADIVFVFGTPLSPPRVVRPLDIVRKRGKVGIVGFRHKLTELPVERLAMEEIEVVGCRACMPKTYLRVLRMTSLAQQDLNQIITHRLPLSAGEKGIKLMKSRKGLKIVLMPQQL